MQQNIKVDVIYYLSPSDFEMEFNLCGCCHMRLLNEKTQDKQSLVKALAKAVSRSKIIIACGPMFDDNGLIRTISTAIGKKTEVINNADYGIKYDDKISVIEGSTPLVTPEGYFGGCIIESGPQAIIVLSESKGIRKTIMNNLIHQYIYELSLLPESALTRPENAELPVSEAEEAVKETEDAQEVAQEIAPEQPAAEEEVVEQENTEELQETKEESENSEDENSEPEDISSVLEQTEDTQEETEQSEETKEVAEEESEQEVTEETDAEPEKAENPEQEENSKKLEASIEFVLEEEIADTDEAPSQLPTETSKIEMFIDPKHISPKKVSDYAKNYVPSEKDSLFVAEEDYEYEYDIDDDDASFKPIPKAKLSIVLIIIVLSLIIVVLLYLMVYIPYSKGIDYASYIEQIFGAASNI